jgi:hypothetical protein
MAELLFWDPTPNITRFALGDPSSRAATVPPASKIQTLLCFQTTTLHSKLSQQGLLVFALSPNSFRRDSFVGFAAREGAVGIYAADATRNRGDISGESLPFQFTIEDNTKGQGDPRHAALREGMPYKVASALHIYTQFAFFLVQFSRLAPGEDYARYLRTVV